MPIKHANQVVAQPLSWLWPDRIPLGKLVLLDGDPDLGKSLIALGQFPPRTPLEEDDLDGDSF